MIDPRSIVVVPRLEENPDKPSESDLQQVTVTDQSNGDVANAPSSDVGNSSESSSQFPVTVMSYEEAGYVNSSSLGTIPRGEVIITSWIT